MHVTCFLVLYVVSLLVIIFLQTLPFWSFTFSEAYAPNSESISRIFSALWLLYSNESRSVSAPLGDDGIQAILVVDLARLPAPQTACFKRPLGVSKLSKPPESVYLFLRILLHPSATNRQSAMRCKHCANTVCLVQRVPNDTKEVGKITENYARHGPTPPCTPGRRTAIALVPAKVATSIRNSNW